MASECGKSRRIVRTSVGYVPGLVRKPWLSEMLLANCVWASFSRIVHILPTRRPSDLAEIGLDDLAYRLRMHIGQFFNSRRPEKRSVALVRGSPTASSKAMFF